MKIYTIGFTQKSARQFFDTLRRNGISQVVDIRLNNTSQLAGFTKKDDLAYFLKALCGVDYYHLEFLAPTKEIRVQYARSKDWDVYTQEYMALLESRDVLSRLERSFFERETCFLCSEASAEHCHRRLLAEYLKTHWEGIEVVHL